LGHTGVGLICCILVLEWVMMVLLGLVA